jgi:hypothetical protein
MVTAGGFAAFAFAANAKTLFVAHRKHTDIPMRIACNGLKKPLSDAIAF